MEVRLPNKNKRSVIILSILAFVFLASGIYLLWRVNQEKTVAPKEGEASGKCVPEYPPYNALPYTTTVASEKSELILYYKALPSILAQFVITDPSGKNHTITTSSTQERIATGIILEEGETAKVKAVYEAAGGKSAVGWQSVSTDNKCGSGVMGPPQDGKCVPYAKTNVSRYISWADSTGGEVLVSRQCWADAKEWEGDYDFNDFFVQFYYLPIASPPPPVCDGGNWDTNGKPSGVYPYCSNISYSFVAKDADGVDKGSIIVKVNNDVRVNASKATLKTGDKEVRVKETLSTETDCLEPGDYTISAVWKDVKGAGGAGTACALTTSFTVAEEVKNPDWNITKVPIESCIDDNTENPKARLEYTITIENTGEGTGEIVAIVDTLDSKVLGTYIENISSNGKFTDGKISWTLTGTDGQFAPGQSKIYTYSLLIPKEAFGTYDNIVDAVPSEGNNLIANATVVADCIVKTPQTRESEPLPETGIFDDTEKTIISGSLLIFLGFTWRILGRGVFVSIEFLGKVPKKISIQMKDIQEDIRAKKRIKEMKVADKRKKNFERKVVKD